MYLDQKNQFIMKLITNIRIDGMTLITFRMLKVKSGFFFETLLKEEVIESLLESEEKYKQLVDKLPEMVFEIDTKGCLVFANLRAVELMGYSKDEFESNFDANRLVVAEDAQRSFEKMKEMFSTGLRQSNEFVFVKKGWYAFSSFTDQCSNNKG